MTYDTKGARVLGRGWSQDVVPLGKKFDRQEQGFDEVPRQFVNAQHKQPYRCGDPAMDIEPPKGE